jgi:hypothetical protein
LELQFFNRELQTAPQRSGRDVCTYCPLRRNEQEISYIGYVKVIVPASQASLVVLSERAGQLEEIVIIVYGTVKKRDMTVG